MLELERVFLVKKEPNLKKHGRVEIWQSYLRNGRRLRRQIDRKVMTYEITEKTELVPGDKSKRDEQTVHLERREYILLLRLMAKRHLRKTRYRIPLGHGLTAELDVFRGRLRGLVLVEVEFPDEDAMEAFAPPAWFGREVTREKWASNSWLAGRSFKEIKSLIKK